MLLIGLAKGLALIVAAGGAGIAIGYGLSKLSGDDEASVAPTSEGVATTTSAGPRTTTATATTAPPTATTTLTTTAPTRTQTTTVPAQTVPAGLRVQVLGAVLRPAGAASGVTPQNGEIVMRIRTENRGSQTVTINRPVLRIGSVRTQLDPDTLTLATQFGPLAAGASKAVTLKFQITGEATPKAIRDRRARIELAGGSVPVRLKVTSE